MPVGLAATERATGRACVTERAVCVVGEMDTTGARATRAGRCVVPPNATDTAMRRDATCVIFVVVVMAVVNADARG